MEAPALFPSPARVQATALALFSCFCDSCIKLFSTVLFYNRGPGFAAVMYFVVEETFSGIYMVSSEENTVVGCKKKN